MVEEKTSISNNSGFTDLLGREGPFETTQTIDLRDVFADDVYSSGSFDLSMIGSTAFGKLLDALPLPALLIGEWYSVVFANQSCTRISANYKEIEGLHFASLVPLPRNAEKAQQLLVRAFETRKPQVAEAILEIEEARIWARLHLRCVRIGMDRHILMLIEDITPEKKQLLLGRRNEQQLKQVISEHGRRAQQEAAKRSEASLQEDARESRVRELEEALEVEKAKFRAVSDRAHFGTAIVDMNGSFEYVNSRFEELFGYTLEELAVPGAWMGKVEPAGEQEAADNWLEVFQSREATMEPVVFLVRCKDGNSGAFDFTAVRLHNGDLLVTCEKSGNDAVE